MPAGRAELRIASAVASRDIRLHNLQARARRAAARGDQRVRAEADAAVQAELRSRARIQARFQEIVRKALGAAASKAEVSKAMGSVHPRSNRCDACCRAARGAYRQHCGKRFDDYALKFFNVWPNLCFNPASSAALLPQIVEAVCNSN